MHKFGLALTLVFAIVGFWDVKGIYDSEVFENVVVPILGMTAICGGLHLALRRA